MFRLIVCVLLVASNTQGAFAKSVAEAFEDNGFIPRVVPEAPDGLAEVKYADFEADLGNYVTYDKVSVPPSVTYDNSPDKYYTVIMLEPDALSDKNPWFSDFQFWLVGNVPGDDVASGETLSEYFKPGPPPLTGTHRYIFLVYDQCGNKTFDEPHYTPIDVVQRTFFSPLELAEKYDFCGLIAGNFYQITSKGPQIV